MHALQGKTFDQAAADDIIVQIQAEKPALIATTRLLPGSNSNLVKVVFVIEKSNEEAVGRSNINSRYMVESVQVQGFDESKLTQSIRDEFGRSIQR